MLKVGSLVRVKNVRDCPENYWIYYYMQGVVKIIDDITFVNQTKVGVQFSKGKRYVFFNDYNLELIM